jgi:hypothetical protein
VLQNEIDRRRISILALCETWHDADFVVISRLRASGFSVVERARPRLSAACLGVNHGGVAIVEVKRFRLTAVTVNPPPTTFVVVAARFTVFQSTCLIVAVYRTGPVVEELADVLDCVATSADQLGPMAYQASKIIFVACFSIYTPPFQHARTSSDSNQ